jgi:hypothetical protein
MIQFSAWTTKNSAELQRYGIGQIRDKGHLTGWFFYCRWTERKDAELKGNLPIYAEGFYQIEYSVYNANGDSFHVYLTKEGFHCPGVDIEFDSAGAAVDYMMKGKQDDSAILAHI